MNNLGNIVLEGFMKPYELKHNRLKITILALGQYGGRAGDEFARLLHTVFAINTSDSDLGDLNVIDERIKLDGYNGAVKDIERGQSAIKDNREKIIHTLKRKEIVDADYVFVFAGMGGGTGNAAVPIILNNLSKVRKPFNGKPSFGAIISVPGAWEKRGIKKNARWGLSHIHELVEKKACGAINIIDNEKLIDMEQKLFNVKSNQMDWSNYGNSALAALFTEIAHSTSLPSGKTFDQDEFLDVLCTPGYLALGKAYIPSQQNLDPNDITNLINESFQNSPNADDYDYELESVNGFISVIQPENGPKIINEKSFRMIEEKFNQFIANAEKPHSGLIETDQWGYIHKSNKQIEDKRKAILYSGVISSQLPKRITEMLKEIDDEEKMLEKKKNEKKTNKLDLTSFKKVEKQEIATTNEPVNNEFDLFRSDAKEENQENPDWNNLDL